MSDPIPEMEALSIAGRAGRVARTTFLSLRNRNFRLYFIGQLISNSGNWLTNIALTLLILNLTQSGLDVGLLAACQYGPMLLFSAYAGAVADRVDKRRMLLVTQSLEMAQSIGLATLAFMHHPPIAGLYALALAGGTFLAFDNPLRRSFVSEMVPPDDLPNAVVLYSTIVNGSRIFGPALAGLLIVTVGYGWCFAVDAASYVAVLICLLLMHDRELYRLAHRVMDKDAVRAGLRYVLSTPVLWISFAMLAFIGTLSYNFSVTLPIFVTRVLHGTDRTYTTLYAIFSVGAVVCSFIVAHRGLVRLGHLVVGAAALGVTMLILAVTSSVGFAAAAVFPVGMASIMYMTATTTIVQMEARQDMHGRVLALQTVLIGGPMAVGGPFLGWLADSLGGRAPLILGGIAALVAAGIGYLASVEFAGRDRSAADATMHRAAQ
ncbi:MAG TPA: MFS transporter [Gemmatimonadaceae bacterium]|nr:MFS transporter [Gemmatimonadaceae bacterium]